MSKVKRFAKPFLSIDGNDISNNVASIELKITDNYWFPIIYRNTGTDSSQNTKRQGFSVTWKKCFIEFDRKDVSSYFGSVHLKENNDPKRAWAGYELIMTMPDPFPSDWHEYIKSFAVDISINVLIRPDEQPNCKHYFECQMYVHLRSLWWMRNKPMNKSRMIMRSLNQPRSLHKLG